VKATAELFDCNHTKYIRGEGDVEYFSILQNVNKSYRNENPVYRIQETHNAFQLQQHIIQVSPVSVAKETILRIIRIYEESDSKTKVAGIGELFSRLRRLKLMRKYVGRTHDGFPPSPLNLQSNTYYTFLLYLTALMGAFAAFVFEFLPVLVNALCSLNLYFQN